MSQYTQNSTSMIELDSIYAAIRDNGFSEQTIQLIDNYTNDILMEKQTLLNSIKRSMQVSAAQVRCSLGRTSSATTREQALQQVQMLQQAKLAQQIGK